MKGREGKEAEEKRRKKRQGEDKSPHPSGAGK
jgi:hypothetical protein